MKALVTLTEICEHSKELTLYCFGRLMKLFPHILNVVETQWTVAIRSDQIFHRFCTERLVAALHEAETEIRFRSK